MTPEIRAAAEAVYQSAKAWIAVDHAHHEFERADPEDRKFWEQQLMLAEFVRAAFPADSDTTVDEQWLLRSGGYLIVEDIVQFDRKDALPVRFFHVNKSWTALLVIDPGGSNTPCCLVRGLKTRWQFRRLASVLGVALKEGN